MTKPTTVADGTRDRVMSFIMAYTESLQYPPSQREIASACGCSLTTANAAIKRLVEEGLLEVADGGGARAMRIVGAKMVLPEVTL